MPKYPYLVKGIRHGLWESGRGRNRGHIRTQTCEVASARQGHEGPKAAKYHSKQCIQWIRATRQVPGGRGRKKTRLAGAPHPVCGLRVDRFREKSGGDSSMSCFQLPSPCRPPRPPPRPLRPVVAGKSIALVIPARWPGDCCMRTAGAACEAMFSPPTVVPHHSLICFSLLAHAVFPTMHQRRCARTPART